MEREKYSLVVSEAVEAERDRGDREMVGLLGTGSQPQMPHGFHTDKYCLMHRGAGAIPLQAGPNAVHIAAAAVEECEFLLTWNFRHIANVRIRREVERILAKHGYTKTTICTPEELI
jgi:hypothetical protein